MSSNGNIQATLHRDGSPYAGLVGMAPMICCTSSYEVKCPTLCHYLLDSNSDGMPVSLPATISTRNTRYAAPFGYSSPRLTCSATPAELRWYEGPVCIFVYEYALLLSYSSHGGYGLSGG